MNYKYLTFFYMLGLASLIVLSGIPLHSKFVGLGGINSASLIFGSLSLLVFSVLPVLGFSYGLYLRMLSLTEIVTDNDIDAIYYLGFLITLLSLIVTVFVFFVFQSDKAKQDVFLVATAFAISLSATAIALVCRISLIMLKERSQRSTIESEFQIRIKDIVSSLDDAYEKLGLVIARVTHQLEKYSIGIEEKLNSRLDQITEHAENKIDDLVEHSVRTILESDLVDSISRTADAINSHQQRILSVTSGLDKSSKKIVSSFERIGDIEADIQSVALKMREFNDVLSASAATVSPDFFSSLTNSIKTLETSLHRLSVASDSATTLFSESATRTSSSMDSKGKELRAANEELANAFIDMAKALASASEIVARGFR